MLCSGFPNIVYHSNHKNIRGNFQYRFGMEANTVQAGRIVTQIHSNDLLFLSSRTLKGIILLINTATPPPAPFVLSCLHKFMPRQSIASSGILSFNHVSVTQTISISCISTSISNSFILLGRDLAFTNITLGKDLLLLILVTLFSKETLIKQDALLSVKLLGLFK